MVSILIESIVSRVHTTHYIATFQIEIAVKTFQMQHIVLLSRIFHSSEEYVGLVSLR